ncbi:MAG: heme NO-binding domain-containing protein [Crocinitomicaceae bacterium]|nr:heme NO-binding domain-containing protein [Crocinitomicaceae bacterium]
MKGVIFTEFLEMVEKEFGDEILEEVIEESGLDGIYTSIGMYPKSDLLKMVSALSKRTKKEVSNIFQFFGLYLLESFTILYPSIFANTDTLFDFLEKAKELIRTEVRKIYPEAKLPNFETKRIDDKKFEIIYYSDLDLGELALGLIQGCLKQFKNEGQVKMTRITENDLAVNFLIKLD